MLILLIPLIFNALLDWYICAAVWKRVHRHRTFWRGLALWSSVFCFVAVVLAAVYFRYCGGGRAMESFMWVLLAYLSIYLPKLVWVLFDLIASLPCLIGGRRVKWLSYIGLIGIAAGAALWWGATVGRHTVRVERVDIARPDVPEAFDGYRIAQISDLHLGTYGSDTTYVAKLVDSINALEPDIVVFTGDAVTRRASEMEPFVETLGRIEAPVYSVMGNHDFGQYYPWRSDSERIENMAEFYDCQLRAHWRLLNNATEYLTAGTDSIALIGVENIGEPRMGSWGNLDVAYEGDLADDRFKILLSHNPWHWNTDIAGAPDKNIALTLAGHTHAMQMEFFGYSPAAWRYPLWKGMHTDSGGQQLYINEGIGTVGIPARLGSATPEITLFTLKHTRA